MTCPNLGQGRRHLHPLGGPKGKATKTLTYYIPAEIVKIATGLIFPSQPKPPAKAGKKGTFHTHSTNIHRHLPSPNNRVNKFSPQLSLRSAVMGAGTCTLTSTSSTVVEPSVTEGQVVDPEIDPPSSSNGASHVNTLKNQGQRTNDAPEIRRFPSVQNQRETTGRAL